MAASIEDFVKRLTRTNRKITFVFTEEFFNPGSSGTFKTDRFRELRNIVKNVRHRKGMNAALRVEDENTLFDVDLVIVGTDYACFSSTFPEISDIAFGNSAVIPGFGTEMIDPQKAKFMVDGFFSDRRDTRIPVRQMLQERKSRQLVLVVEKPADLKRPSLEPIRDLRHRLYTILVNPEKGPIVDCQVSKLFQEGNSNSLSALMNKFCVEY